MLELLWGQQIAAFGGVNLIAAGVVICVAIVLRLVLLQAGVAPFHAEMIAHAGGLAAGAPLNFSGHLLVTFRARGASPGDRNTGQIPPGL